MRRTSLFSLLGLTTLSLVSVTLSGSSQAEERRQVVVTTKNKKFTILVSPPGEQDDSPKALSDDEGKGKKKGDKGKGKADKKAIKDEPKEDSEEAEDKADKGKADKSDKGDKAKEKEDPAEHARNGVVAIERAGEVVGMGTVLGNDGRILTALSPLSDGNNLAIRYPDGSKVKAKVGHSNRLWDMAMLVPQVGKWPEGLSASNADPTKQKALKSFTPGKGKAQAAPVTIKNKKSFLGADEQMLSGVFELGSKLGAKEMGSPIIDDSGNVVAMVGRACVPVDGGPCLPSPVGMPVPAIKQFLSTAPPNAVRPAPWLGIRGVPEKGTVSGVRVLGVLPESPADEAGVKGGNDKSASDLIVAVDDHPVGTPEDLSKAILNKAVGERAKLLLFRNGKFQESTVLLQPAPAKK